MTNVQQFFIDNPDAYVVFEALGYLYGNREDADKLIGGTTATVIIHSAPVPVNEELPPALTITNETLTDMPEMIGHGLKVGDEVLITKQPDIAAGESGIVE